MKKEVYEQYAALNKQEKKTNELYHRIAMRLGISDSVFWTLYNLYETAEALTQNDIAGNMGFPKQTIHSAIRSLVKDGYVYLSQKAVARNSKTVHLSDKGRAFCKKYIQPVMNTEEAAADRLTEEEFSYYLSIGEKLNLCLQQELTMFLKTMGGETK